MSVGARRGGLSVHRVSTNVHGAGAVAVKEADCMFSSVAGEVSVVAVDHGQAGAHVARKLEGGEAGTEGEGREGVAEIVDAAERLDPGRALGGLPVAVAKVVEVKVTAVDRGEQKIGGAGGWELVERGERDRL